MEYTTVADISLLNIKILENQYRTVYIFRHNRFTSEIHMFYQIWVHVVVNLPLVKGRNLTKNRFSYSLVPNMWIKLTVCLKASSDSSSHFYG